MSLAKIVHDRVQSSSVQATRPDDERAVAIAAEVKKYFLGAVYQRLDRDVTGPGTQGRGVACRNERDNEAEAHRRTARGLFSYFTSGFDEEDTGDIDEGLFDFHGPDIKDGNQPYEKKAPPASGRQRVRWFFGEREPAIFESWQRMLDERRAEKRERDLVHRHHREKTNEQQMDQSAIRDRRSRGCTCASARQSQRQTRLCSYFQFDRRRTEARVCGRGVAAA